MTAVEAVGWEARGGGLEVSKMTSMRVMINSLLSQLHDKQEAVVVDPTGMGYF